MFTQSIRWRLQLWLAFLLVAVLGGFGFAVYQLQRTRQFNLIDEELQLRVAALGKSLRDTPPGGRGDRPPPERQRPDRPPDFQDGGRPFQPLRGRPPGPPPEGVRGPFDRPLEIRLTPEATSLFATLPTNGFYYTLWSHEGKVLKRSENSPVDLAFPARVETGLRAQTRTRGTLREAYRFTEMGDCVLAGRSIKSDLDALRRLVGWLFAAGGTVLAFGLGGGWWLTSRAIRPIERISTAASRISAGNLAERINVANTDSENELGQLAEILNSTFSRLDAAFAQQKQFTADASHELRTPLTVVIAEAQSTLARERSPEEYRETIETCLEAAQQMRRLTESLLELARFDANQAGLTQQSCDLAEIAGEALEKLRPLALEKSLQLQFDLKPAPVNGDPIRLGQVVTNLLTNAIAYTPANGEIRVATSTEEGQSILSVADTGVGISAEDLPHIFERFYRADKSRTRANGHTGLGLAICKAIIDAHGGTLEAASEIDVGTTFTVRLG